jgi:hypothetical protein
MEGSDLLRRFAGVSDGRSDQGRDHPVAVVLTLCAAAVLAGMRSFTAIAGWVADVPADLLTCLYRVPAPGFPSKTTLWRVLTGADASAVDAAIGAWLLGQAHRTAGGRESARQTAGGPESHADHAGGALLAVAVDGKTLRGAAGPTATRCTCWPQPPTAINSFSARSKSGRKRTRSRCSHLFSTGSPSPAST